MQALLQEKHMTEILSVLVLSIFSPSFENNGMLPVQFTGFGEDISPEIIIENLSEDAEYLAVAFCDEDMPFSNEYCHWVCWNIPAVDKIPQGIPAGETIDEPFSAVQGVGYGRHKYRGPKPPFHSKHNYHFTVYALDAELDLPSSVLFKDVKKAMEGHILQQASIRCWYQNSYSFCH